MCSFMQRTMVMEMEPCLVIEIEHQMQVQVQVLMQVKVLREYLVYLEAFGSR